MIRSLYSLLLAAAPLVLASSDSISSDASLATVPLARRDDTEVTDVHDACVGRSFINSISGFDQELQVNNVAYRGNNVYDVTIHVFGRITLPLNLFESLTIKGINGPQEEVVVYNSDSGGLLGSLVPTEYTVTFQSYGIVKGDNVWLPNFELEYSYSNGLLSLLGSSTEYTLTAGCNADGSSTADYYWSNPDATAQPSSSSVSPSISSFTSSGATSGTTTSVSSSAAGSVTSSSPVSASSTVAGTGSISGSTGASGVPSSGPSGTPSAPTDALSGTPSAPTDALSGSSSAPTGESSSTPSGTPSVPTDAPSGSSSGPTGESSSTSSGTPSVPTDATSGSSSAPTGASSSAPSGSSSAPTGASTSGPSGASGSSSSPSASSSAPSGTSGPNGSSSASTGASSSAPSGTSSAQNNGGKSQKSSQVETTSSSVHSTTNNQPTCNNGGDDITVTEVQTQIVTERSCDGCICPTSGGSFPVKREIQCKPSEFNNSFCSNRVSGCSRKTVEPN